ncbi:MAG: helicase-associated domain-containing protein [Ktedonobacterales bacterium]
MKSLSAVLGDESLASLRELAAWWGVEPPMQDDAEARQRLERAMRDTIASRFVWERLDDDERRTLFAVVGPSARNWLALDALAERTHIESAVAEAALQRLIGYHLVLTETAKIQGGELVGQRATFYGYAMPRNTQAPIEEKVIAYTPTELATGLYTTGREIFVGHVDRSSKTLDELLMPYRQGDLDQIGRRFGLSVQAYYSRNEVRAAIAENLTQAEAVRYALARVEPPLRDVYEWLRRRDGSATCVAVRGAFHLDDVALSALLHTLEEYALAFDTFSDGQRILFIPKETLANLRHAEERPQTSIGLREAPQPRAVRPADPTFLWDLAALTAAAHHQEIELTRSSALPKRAAQRLLPALASERARRSEEDGLIYLDVLKQEACELGLLVAPASTAKARAHLAPGARIDSWGKHDVVMQARRLFRRWPTDRWWVDLPGAQYQEWLTFYLEPALAREVVTKLLRECRAGVWYSLASFRATVQGDDPYVFRPEQRHAGEAGFKLAEDLRAQWDRTDGEIISGIFRSTLYELGLVALGYDRDAPPAASEDVNPDYFLLTEMGAEALNGELSASKQPTARSLVVQPNFQALLMEPYMPALYWLARYAALEQMGRVSRFTLTREALQPAFRQGLTIDEILAFLEAHAQKALPQNVIFTMHDWARQYREQQELAKMHVLEANDEAVAGEIVTSPKLRAFRLSRVGPRSVAVPPETSLGELRRALEKLGYAQKLLSGFEDLVVTAAGLPRRRRAARRSRATAPAIKGA